MNGIAQESRIETKEPKLIILVLLILSIYSFFGYMLPKNMSYGLLAVSAIIMIYSIILKKNVKLSTKQLILASLIILFIANQLLLAPYSMFADSSIKTAINRSVILIIGVFILFQGNWYKTGTKFLFIFSCTHAIFTVASYLLPSFFNGVILPIIPREVSVEIVWFMARDVYPGITNQIGRNAFYITIGISILYSQLVMCDWKSNKFKYAIFLLLLLALLLTGKRGHLLANLMTMIFVSAIYAKYRNKGFFRKTIKIFFALAFVIFGLALIFPEAAAPFMRFIARQGGDQTSGRLVLFSSAFDLFKQKPILGWGPGVFSNLFEMGNHNVYLQLLSENGLVGFTLFVSMLLFNLSTTLRKLKFNIKNNYSLQNNTYLFFSLYVQVFYLIYGMTGNPLNDGFILIIYLIAASIPYTMKTKEKAENLI